MRSVLTFSVLRVGADAGPVKLGGSSNAIRGRSAHATRERLGAVVEAPIMTLEQLRVFGEVAVGRVSRSITKPRRVA